MFEYCIGRQLPNDVGDHLRLLRLLWTAETAVDDRDTSDSSDSSNVGRLWWRL